MHISNHINAYCAEPPQRDFDMLTLKLRTERLLNGTLRLGNCESVNCDRACLRERDLALAVNGQA